MSDSEQEAIYQPDELGQLKTVVKDFVSKLEMIENEIRTLQEERSELIDEAKKNLDVKTLSLVLRVLKIKGKVQHKDTFDVMLSILEDDV